MQPVDPIINLDQYRPIDLHMFGLHIAISPALMWWGIFLAFGTTSYCLSLWRSKYRLSNMRAKLCACPLRCKLRRSPIASASTETAAGSGPAPSPTPAMADSVISTPTASATKYTEDRFRRGCRSTTSVETVPAAIPITSKQ